MAETRKNQGKYFQYTQKKVANFLLIKRTHKSRRQSTMEKWKWRKIQTFSL